MKDNGPRLPRHEMGKLHRGLASAADVQIARVVAMVDALEARGVADDVIAPLRPRLAHLRPRRPLRFCRLLFMPLDPLIVPAADWRADSPTIPRTILPPVAEMVHDAMGADAVAVEAMIRGHAAENVDLAAKAGARLWPAATAILASSATLPASWGKTGMPAAIGIDLLRRIASLFAQVETLHALFAEAEIGVSLRSEALAPLVQATAAEGMDTLAMMAALILARLPQSHRLLIRAGRVLGEHGDAHVRVAVERAIEVLLHRLETSSGVEALVVGSDLAQAGSEVRRINQLLECLEANQARADQQPRLSGITRRLDACCRLRFGSAMETEFAAALQQLGDEPSQADLAELEDAARGLHDLKQEARRIGSPELYDRLLQQAAALVKAPGSERALSLVDRVRLVEILVGPDEALAMLEPAQSAEMEPA